MANNRYNDKKGRLEIPSVTIETVDRAVRDYFAKKLAMSVNTGSERKKVPVIFATGERWNLIRDDKGLRDENGTLILPLIAVMRTEIDRSTEYRGVAQEVKQFMVSSNIHPKNSNLQQQVYKRKKNGFPTVTPEKTREYITIPFPDFANLIYEIKIWAQYTSQMNEMLEKIFYAYNHLNSFVMPVEYDGDEPKGDSYYFVGHANEALSADSNVEEFTDQERIVKYTYSITVPAYFMLNPKDEALSYGRDQEGKNITIKKQSANRFVTTEQLITLEEFEELFG